MPPVPIPVDTAFAKKIFAYVDSLFQNAQRVGAEYNAENGGGGESIALLIKVLLAAAILALVAREVDAWRDRRNRREQMERDERQREKARSEVAEAINRGFENAGRALTETERRLIERIATAESRIDECERLDADCRSRLAVVERITSKL